ncbi:putative transcriptional regulator, GntR family; C-term aminotransferase motif [Cupriavidus taiwanensis]|uniref:aminotransferase-like domain-containing protein n=1 Tax=Cupriavidus TaxID=106589 RepID=UPI000E11C991|nr:MULTISPECIES: PLP-dependent aminotransferase family protein [Cupriavidus]UDM50431.1 PLP-dependent aminotransferase family protein [Cupriavidus sp. MP-37]SOZ14913.1 putative transcriptional regulator, GntR family; C-term aminotransferase motif [Cupriavidus taiwanensis]SOZ26764.1 putative transcriptional regulator, GntR family; C-term aminotransferase motif [Cupriavidus taiwanensis]SOZ45488.1 putative transcriptional regulator, GntR family; C-term aminotransferase motif [Cupriavidus taiwanensi
MKLILDASTGIPLTEQIVEGVKAWIGNREARPGARLPSIRQLAAENGISRFPVIEAYDRLVSQGLLDSRQGSGFYVADSPLAGRSARGWSDPSLAEDLSDHILEQFNHPSGTLKLAGGFVPENWRDVEGLTQAIRAISRNEIDSVIHYATPMGHPELRRQVLLRVRQLGIAAELPQVLITTGASQALDLVVRHLLKPGDTVFVEDPGYYNLFGLLRLHGVQLVGVPHTPDGPDPDATEALLRQHKPKLFFTNSVLQNPTGSTLAPPVAFRLLELARRHGFRFVEDDIFSDFQTHFTDRLATLDQLEHVIYIGGFSKTVSASLRIGYLVADKALVKDLVDVKVLTSVAGSHFAEAVTAALLERGGYRKYVERLRLRVREAVANAVRQLHGNGWEVFCQPSGGNFLWARPPGIEDSRELVTLGEEFGVTLAPGNYFRPGGETSAWIRINAAYANEPRAVAFMKAAAERGAR